MGDDEVVFRAKRLGGYILDDRVEKIGNQDIAFFNRIPSEKYVPGQFLEAVLIQTQRTQSGLFFLQSGGPDEIS